MHAAILKIMIPHSVDRSMELMFDLFCSCEELANHELIERVSNVAPQIAFDRKASHIEMSTRRKII